MAITQVQKVTYGSAAAATDHNVTITAPTNNNLLVLIVCADSTLPAVGSWTQAGWTKAVSGVDFTETGIWYRVASGFGTTVTFTLGGSANAGATVFEYSGTAAASPLDKTASNASAGSAPSPLSTGTTAATAQADEVGIGTVGVNTTTVERPNNWTTPQNGYAEESDVSTPGSGQKTSHATQSLVLSATGTQQTGETPANGGSGSGAIATFKAAATAADPGVPPSYPPPVGSQIGRFLQPWWDPDVTGVAGPAASGDTEGDQRTSGTATTVKGAVGATSGQTRASGLSTGTKGALGASSGQQRASGVTADVKGGIGAATGDQRSSGLAVRGTPPTGAGVGQQRVSGLSTGAKGATSATAAGQQHSSGTSADVKGGVGAATGQTRSSGAAVKGTPPTGAGIGQTRVSGLSTGRKNATAITAAGQTRSSGTTAAKKATTATTAAGQTRASGTSAATKAATATTARGQQRTSGLLVVLPPTIWAVSTATVAPAVTGDAATDLAATGTATTDLAATGAATVQ